MEQALTVCGIVLVFVWHFCACTPEPVIPDLNKIYVSYSLNYNKTKDKTSAAAGFYLASPSTTNQQRLELNHPARVKYNSDELVFNTNDRYYQKEFIGNVESNFIYEDYNGLVHINEIEMVDWVFLMLFGDSSSMQFDLHFQVLGPDLGSTEVLKIEVESINSGMKFGLEFTTLAGLIVQIQSQQLQSLGIGPAIIKVTRVFEQEVDQGSLVGGKVVAEYMVQDTVHIF